MSVPLVEESELDNILKEADDVGVANNNSKLKVSSQEEENQILASAGVIEEAKTGSVEHQSSGMTHNSQTNLIEPVPKKKKKSVKMAFEDEEKPKA